MIRDHRKRSVAAAAALNAITAPDYKPDLQLPQWNSPGMPRTPDYTESNEFGSVFQVGLNPRESC